MKITILQVMARDEKLKYYKGDMDASAKLHVINVSF